MASREQALRRLPDRRRASKTKNSSTTRGMKALKCIMNDKPILTPWQPLGPQKALTVFLLILTLENSPLGTYACSIRDPDPVRMFQSEACAQVRCLFGRFMGSMSCLMV